MEREIQIKISRKVKKLLLPFYLKLGFEPDGELTQFSDGQTLVNLDIGGDYYKYVTIVPKIILKNKDIILEGLKYNVNLNHNGLFNLDRRLANEFGVSDYDECKYNDDGHQRLIHQYKVFNDKDINELCIDHMEYVSTVGLLFLDKISSHEGLFDFYLSILNKKASSKEGKNNAKSQLNISVSKEVVLSSVLLGKIICSTQLEQLIKLIIHLYENNDYIMADFNKILQQT